MTEEYDTRRINDRYDAWKAFHHEGRAVGVALEIERWQINNDLLKFVRGQARQQMAVGVILHADPAEVAYSYEHSIRMAAPLWQELPLVLCSPDGPGLPPYGLPVVKASQQRPFRYPDSG
jgi:hypothetical protein